MKVKKCPIRKTCFDYADSNCDNCAFGEELTKLHKRIDRLRKQNKTVTEEKDALIYKLECLLCHATGSKLSKHTYDIRTMETGVTDYIDEAWDEGYADAAKQVSMEVFKELDNLLRDLIIPHGEFGQVYYSKASFYLIGKSEYAELKKKYTEGGE